MYLLKKIFIILIRGYQKLISPLFPPRCRFQPTCSQYCIEALYGHHFFKGLALSLKRIFRCHPWGGSGYDPVPKNKEK
jgi:putative membrane protein insertion efficiency factor